MNRIPAVLGFSSALVVTLSLLAGCSGTPETDPAPLDASNVNLIFVVSEDVTFHSPGDLNTNTANLTSRGLQRALRMGTFLQQNVISGNNVTRIYALEPMTHLETANSYPDMAALETIQEFAMLNQTTISIGGTPTTANSFPILGSYAAESVPKGVAPPATSCPPCQGLDFTNANGDNDELLGGILQSKTPGYYVFSAPWETATALMGSVNHLGGYGLPIPSSYLGANFVYAISIAPSGGAILLAYNARLSPPSTYPTLPPPGVTTAPCSASQFQIQVTPGVGGAVLPPGINSNETVYMIRHAEAHPADGWDDGNYIGAGQWRALDLPNALVNQIHPTQIFSIDPANAIPEGTGSVNSSYIRPSLTVEPFAIANGMPLNLAASVAVFSQNPPALSTFASNFFFTRGAFSNQILLVGWEHDHIPPTVNALLTSYHAAPTQQTWPDTDYDTIWTIRLDAQSNLSVNNSLCEGIDSTSLPPSPPQF